MVFTKVLILLDIYFLKNKDLESHISYSSGYIENGSFSNRERRKNLKIRDLGKDSQEKSLDFMKRENYNSKN